MRIVRLGLLVALSAACDPHVHGGPPQISDQEVILTPDDPPPALTGGTLIVGRDGRTAIAADPDRDVVWRIDLSRGEVLSATALEAGDEPGRLVEDTSGRIHVALRRGGAIATIDPRYPQRVERKAVCPEPRGIAHDPVLDEVHVACTDGELVTLRAADRQERRRLQLAEDLRDVVVSGDRLLVSRFKTAEVLAVDPSGDVVSQGRPDAAFGTDFMTGESLSFEPAVAWRMVSGGDGSLVMAHQRGQVEPISIDEPDSYGGDAFDCGSPIVQSAVTVRRPDGSFESSDRISGSVLPVDVAVAPRSGRVALVSAGTFRVSEFAEPPVQTDADFAEFDDIDEGCGLFAQDTALAPENGTPVAVAYDRDDALWVQTRTPASIVRIQGGLILSRVTLPGPAVGHSGHEAFHTAASQNGSRLTVAMVGAADMEDVMPRIGADLACASCHPEGREDGRTWVFDPIGPRRTQSVAGGILETAPFHWDGELGHLGDLMDEVFVERMGGQLPSQRRLSAIAQWVDSIPAPRAGRPVSEDAVARGAALFASPQVGCTDCHSGAHLTNNASVRVGTGVRLQVPSLVGIAARAPYLHDGRAATLRDRFRPEIGGGDEHGHTSQLSDDQIDDLIAYLETL